MNTVERFLLVTSVSARLLVNKDYEYCTKISVGNLCFCTLTRIARRDVEVVKVTEFDRISPVMLYRVVKVTEFQGRE